MYVALGFIMFVALIVAAIGFFELSVPILFVCVLIWAIGN